MGPKYYRFVRVWFHSFLWVLCFCILFCSVCCHQVLFIFRNLHKYFSHTSYVMVAKFRSWQFKKKINWWLKNSCDVKNITFFSLPSIWSHCIWLRDYLLIFIFNLTGSFGVYWIKTLAGIISDCVSFSHCTLNAPVVTHTQNMCSV